MNPRLPIRRFDVFAEYNRLKAIKDGADEAHAKGYGLWVAKVVASGGGRHTAAHPAPKPDEEGKSAGEHEQAPKQEEWHTIGGEDQTDDLFDREVINRMGSEFYDTVFAPALAQTFDEGRRYESIRDTIRKDWKPGK